MKIKIASQNPVKMEALKEILVEKMDKVGILRLEFKRDPEICSCL